MRRKEMITDRKKERETMDDRNRSGESRDSERRDNFKRAIMNMSYADPLYIDPERIPAGMVYRWIRESIRDLPDDARLAEMSKKGWTPVPADRHPERAFSDFFGRLERMHNYIYHKGLILFERPKELDDLEQKMASDRNAKIMNSIPGVENLMGEPTMPLTRKTYETSMSHSVVMNN